MTKAQNAWIAYRDRERGLNRPSRTMRRREFLAGYAAGKAEKDTEFLEWLISLDDPDHRSQGAADRRTVTLNKIINRARTALGRDPE